MYKRQLSDSQIIVVENIPDASVEADSSIVQLIDEGCNLIIGGSSGFTKNMNAAYTAYPDVYFAQFEGDSADNYCSFTCVDIEAIFMCGYAAALMSGVAELGFVAAQPQSSVIRAINAWSAGAKAANPNATVRVMWVNSWYDPATEKECATTLIQAGVQSMGYHGGTTAVCEACEDAGAYVTGFHTDKEAYAPQAVLTSFCWNWTPIFNEIITQVATESWTSDTKYGNMADGVAGIAPWNADIMPQEVINQCNEMYEAIVDGDYVVLEGPVAVSYTHLDVYKRQVLDLAGIVRRHLQCKQIDDIRVVGDLRRVKRLCDGLCDARQVKVRLSSVPFDYLIHKPHSFKCLAAACLECREARLSAGVSVHRVYAPVRRRTPSCPSSQRAEENSVLLP